MIDNLIDCLIDAPPLHRVPIDVKDNEATVPGLVEGKEYEFRVSAVNNAGVGEPSDSSGAIEAVPAPSAPKIGEGFVLGNLVVLAGDPFVLKIPYTGFPPPTAAWSNVSHSISFYVF